MEVGKSEESQRVKDTITKHTHTQEHNNVIVVRWYSDRKQKSC